MAQSFEKGENCIENNIITPILIKKNDSMRMLEVVRARNLKKLRNNGPILAESPIPEAFL